MKVDRIHLSGGHAVVEFKDRDGSFLSSSSSDVTYRFSKRERKELQPIIESLQRDLTESEIDRERERLEHERARRKSK